MFKATIAAALSAVAAVLITLAGTAHADEPGVYCYPPKHASGHMSLRQLAKKSKVDMAQLVYLQAACTPAKPHHGWYWTPKFESYLNEGGFGQPMPKGMPYWTKDVGPID